MNIKVCSVAAVASNGVIGNEGGIPWKLPSDFKWFKQLTLDHVVIMGRKTWDSLPKKPLPKRYNIVVTSKPLNVETDEPFDYAGNVFATSDLTDALSIGMFEARRRRQDKIFVIGGESLYNAYFKLIERHYITIHSTHN